MPFLFVRLSNVKRYKLNKRASWFFFFTFRLAKNVEDYSVPTLHTRARNKRFHSGVSWRIDFKSFSALQTEHFGRPFMTLRQYDS